MVDMKKGARITGANRDKLAAQITKKYEGGASIRELSESTGRSYGFVHRLLSESGATMRGRGGATRGKDARTTVLRSTDGPASKTAGAQRSATTAKNGGKTTTGRAKLHSVK